MNFLITKHWTEMVYINFHLLLVKFQRKINYCIVEKHGAYGLSRAPSEAANQRLTGVLAHDIVAFRRKQNRFSLRKQDKTRPAFLDCVEGLDWLCDWILRLFEMHTHWSWRPDRVSESGCFAITSPGYLLRTEVYIYLLTSSWLHGTDSYSLVFLFK